MGIAPRGLATWRTDLVTNSSTSAGTPARTRDGIGTVRPAAGANGMWTLCESIAKAGQRPGDHRVQQAAEAIHVGVRSRSVDRSEQRGVDRQTSDTDFAGFGPQDARWA